MPDTQFTTIGRTIYPGKEVKISCTRDVNTLGRESIKNRFRIVYVKEGFGVFHNGTNSQVVTCPMVLCLNHTDVVQILESANLVMDIMYFDPACFEKYRLFDTIDEWKHELGEDAHFFRAFFNRNRSYLGACPTNTLLGDRIAQLILSAENELTEQRDSYWPCRSRSFFIELLLLVNSIYDEESEQNQIYNEQMTDDIREVINWLHIHFLDRVIIDDVTQQFHTNKTTLNKKFKAATGLTVTEYIINLRMQIACSFLRKTFLTIKEIIGRCGYKDDAHFLRAFRKFTGCTPTEYRNQFDISSGVSE